MDSPEIVAQAQAPNPVQPTTTPPPPPSPSVESAQPQPSEPSIPLPPSMPPVTPSEPKPALPIQSPVTEPAKLEGFVNNNTFGAQSDMKLKTISIALVFLSMIGILFTIGYLSVALGFFSDLNIKIH